MKLRPFPHQLAGADHLVARKVAGLWDDPRVGKNLATIIACDRLQLRKILFITTVSGRAVAAAAFRDNQTIDRKIQIMAPKDRLTGDLVIASWAGINNPTLRSKLLAEMWQAIVIDESHYAKAFTAQRTRNVYGTLRLDGQGLDQTHALAVRSERVWLLTGTPVPHDLSDLYPAMRALVPELLLAHNGMPDVTTLTRFKNRYCIMKPYKPTPYVTKWIVVGGQNEAELKRRLNGTSFALRRTQKDVGILPARFSFRPLQSDRFEPIIEQGMSREEIEEILASRRYADANLARLMHQHGIIKAHAAVQAVEEEFDCGLDKIVLGYWHQDVGQILSQGLAQFGVVGINGQTPFKDREQLVREFSIPGGPKRIFLQQISAAGESIDLSASGVLWFIESIFQPGAMKQASERVTNVNNTRNPIVETCYVQGSIDEIIQDRLASLWMAIHNVITH
jgi:SWI/SNF-related matrix-associated actin-dependent regulator of chromatin subfamily A-like protein 1